MSEHVARTRIWLRNASYLLTEEFDEVVAAYHGSEPLIFTSLTGQAAFPPERLFFDRDAVLSIQECSPESWVWQQHADEIHYARQLQEMGSSPQERLAEAQERIAAAFSSHEDDE